MRNDGILSYPFHLRVSFPTLHIKRECHFLSKDFLQMFLLYLDTDSKMVRQLVRDEYTLQKVLIAAGGIFETEDEAK